LRKTFALAATYILDKASIDFKLRRLALEIAERNINSEQIVLAGIEPNGVVMAGKLKELLKEWYAGKIDEISIELDKKNPGEIKLTPETDLTGKVVIIVDDVANSGKTLTYAIRPFLYTFPKQIQTLVLVDRTHKAFPVQPDYVGFRLATTLNDYINVEVEDGELVAACVD
jgi:pyrimidine operon attenuation protein/uracil phosphoribosyltransferase